MNLAYRDVRRNLEAQLRSLEIALSEVPSSDRINRMSIEQDLMLLQRRLAELDSQGFASSDSSEASFFALYFSGDPVIAERGIDLDFAGRALANFQSLVSSVVSSRQGASGKRGPIRDRDKSALHVTGVVRGSFGFKIEPIARQLALFEEETVVALDHVAKMLVTVSDPFSDLDAEKVFDDANGRVLDNVSTFLNHIERAGARLRFSTRNLDHEIGEREFAISRKKLEITEVEEETQVVRLTMNGFLPQRHRFEAYYDGEIIYGLVARSIDEDELKEWQSDNLYVPVDVKLKTRNLKRNGEVVRTSYTLLSLT